MSDRESAPAKEETVLLALMWLSSSLVPIGQQGRDWLNLESVLLFLHSRNLLR